MVRSTWISCGPGMPGPTVSDRAGLAQLKFHDLRSSETTDNLGICALRCQYADGRGVPPGAPI
jgi:hypothetical protein